MSFNSREAAGFCKFTSYIGYFYITENEVPRLYVYLKEKKQLC